MKLNNIIGEETIGGFKVTTIEKATKFNLNEGPFRHHNDINPYGSHWFFNPECPHAGQYSDIEELQSKEYFEQPDNMKEEWAKEVADFMFDCYIKIKGDLPESILELGAMSGEFTNIFANNGIKYVAVEGNDEACQIIEKRGLKVLHRNLKFWEGLVPYLTRFDICMCTEVAEHIEPSFSSQIVKLCTMHSDFVFFSTPEDEEGPAGHYVHPSLFKAAYWDNLFAHFGFNKFIDISKECPWGRGTRIYMKGD